MENSLKKSWDKEKLDKAYKDMKDYYPTKKDFLIALDDILYALFCIDTSEGMMLPMDVHNCAFSIRLIKNVILATNDNDLTFKFTN